MSYLRRSSQTASSSGEEERDGRRGRGGWREEEKEEMKPKLGKFSRRFSIPGCLGAEAARRSRGPFPREFGYSEQFLLGLHTSIQVKGLDSTKEKARDKKGKIIREYREKERSVVHSEIQLAVQGWKNVLRHGVYLA